MRHAAALPAVGHRIVGGVRPGGLGRRLLRPYVALLVRWRRAGCAGSGEAAGSGIGARFGGLGRRLLRPYVSLLVLMCMPAVVRAQAFDLTLDPHTLSGSTGQTVTFIGLLENTLGSTAEFTGMTVSLPGFDPDDVSILFDFAGLGDTETRLTDAFSVYINPSVGNGAYYGTLYLDYTYNGGASSGQAVQNFRVNAVPETALIQLPILPALGGAAWWKRRRHAP